jgi:hypothetical protein
MSAQPMKGAALRTSGRVAAIRLVAALLHCFFMR